MRAVWELGEASVKDIQEFLPGNQHYNSLLTIIRVLEKKGHLTHRADGRAHVYRPKKKQADTLNRSLSHFVKNMFGGSAASLVLNLVETGELTREDIDEIRKRVAAREKAGRKR